MGGQGSRRREQRGQDLKYEIDVDLREAYTGIKKEISFDTLVRCDNCEGSGSEKRSGLKDCGACGGCTRRARVVAERKKSGVQKLEFCATEFRESLGSPHSHQLEYLPW